MMVEDRRVDRNSSVIINMMAQANKASRGATEERGEHELNLVTGDKLASRGWGVDTRLRRHTSREQQDLAGGGEAANEESSCTLTKQTYQEVQKLVL